MTEATWTPIIVSVGIGLNILIQIFRESRNRKWDNHDRDRRTLEASNQASAHTSRIAQDLADTVVSTAAKVAETVKDTAEALAAQLKETNAQIAAVAARDKSHTLQKIEENTKLSVKALEEVKAADAVEPAT